MVKIDRTPVNGVYNKDGLDVNEDICPVCGKAYGEVYIVKTEETTEDWWPICIKCLIERIPEYTSLTYFLFP